MTTTAEVHTTDTAWSTTHGAPAPEGRTRVPVAITGSYTFRGRTWYNIALAPGTPVPSDWRKQGAIMTALAAPAEWVHGA